MCRGLGLLSGGMLRGVPGGMLRGVPGVGPAVRWDVEGCAGGLGLLSGGMLRGVPGVGPAVRWDVEGCAGGSACCQVGSRDDHCALLYTP